MVVVRPVSVDQWALLRDVRLTALSEAPAAFGSSYAREVEFTEAQWRGRISSKRSVTFLAGLGDSAPGRLDDAAGRAVPAGIAGVYVEASSPDLVSMWVRPGMRGRRVGEALAEAAAGWAREHGFPTLFLWVTEGNVPAVRLYERCGFTLTGEKQPLPSDPSLSELRMSRPLERTGGDQST